MNSLYDDPAWVDRLISDGRHRDAIGGLWDEVGLLQFSCLRTRGLEPHHRLLDVGCGSLRLGRLAIPWLEPLRYFGLDSSRPLIDAGWSHELDDDGRRRAPPSQFDANSRFDFSFVPAPIDFAIAQSVFTHLPINHLRRCLLTLADHMVPGGTFYVTVFDIPASTRLTDPCQHSPGGVTTFDFQDPYHYRRSDLDWAVAEAPWRLEWIGDWSHPRDQKLVAFHRL